MPNWVLHRETSLDKTSDGETCTDGQAVSAWAESAYPQSYISDPILRGQLIDHTEGPAICVIMAGPLLMGWSMSTFAVGSTNLKVPQRQGQSSG